VILVDNGSTDGVPEAAAQRYDNVELLPAGSNRGYGRAANLGAARAETEWIVVANQDLQFAPGSLDVLFEATARWPRAGSLGPAILTPDGSLYPSARALPSLGRGIGHALCGWWWPSNPWTSSYRQERGTPTEHAVGWLSGSCLLVRAEAFAGIQGFDPSYFMYFEDLDLGERFGRAGWLNVYVPDAVVTHQGGQATERDRSAMVAEHHRSAYRYLSRRYSGLRWLPLRMALKCGLAARNALSQLIFAVGEGAKPTRKASALRRRRS
jgi:N-acetylglucosaminyl-diphospho-decaprenol L-rhamnosyltransferase